MSRIKLVVVGLAALCAIDSALAAAVNSGKRKVEVDGRQVVSITTLGTGQFVVVLNDAVLTAGPDAKITGHLTDSSVDVSGLVLSEVGKVEVEAEQFSLSKFDPEKHDVFTRSGNRVTQIIDAGIKAPTFGRVIFVQNHANGYLLSGKCSADGRISDKHEHTQDLLVVPKGSVKVDLPSEAAAEAPAPGADADENPLG